MKMDFKRVPKESWDTDDKVPVCFREEIASEIDPECLIGSLLSLFSEALDAQRSEQTVAAYDEAVGDKSKRDFRRSCIVAVVKSSTIFSQFFNGRCGYRAMYWHGSASVSGSTARLWQSSQQHYERTQTSRIPLCFRRCTGLRSNTSTRRYGPSSKTASLRRAD